MAERTTSHGGQTVIDDCQKASALAGDIRRESIQELLDFLGHEHPFVRWEAGVALAGTAVEMRKRSRLGMSVWSRHSPASTFGELLTLMENTLHSPDPQRRVATADALGMWDHEAVVPLLLPMLEDSEPLVRAGAVAALGKTRDKASIDALLSALVDPYVWVRRAAADALGAIGAPRAVPALEISLLDPEPLVRTSVVCALGHMKTAKARRLLARCVHDDDPAIRWYSARGLANIGTVSSLPALKQLLEDDAEMFGQSISDLAATAIEAIEKRESGPWNWLRKAVYNVLHLLERKKQSWYTAGGTANSRGGR